MTNSFSPEPVDLSDPSISAHRLQELAQSHPEQWDEILDHPNVYPGLADWIHIRQAELAATGGEGLAVEPSPEEDHADDATKVFEAPQLSDNESDLDIQDDADLPETSDADLPDESPVENSHPDDSQSPWAMPNAPRDDQPSATPTTDTGAPSWTQASQEAPQQPAQSQQDQQTWGWSQPTGQQQFGYGQYAQQPGPQQQFGYPQYGSGQAYGHPQQFGQPQQYGQPQQFGQAPSYAKRSGASRIDLSSSNTWGLFIAGGAAFLSLFGFIFNPGLQYMAPFASHMAAGGWIVLLLFLATVALSLLQLLKPSTWMRFFFIVVSLGAGFAMLGRAGTLIGFYTMRGTSFSVLWLLFMSLVLLAGAMMFLAPKFSDRNGQPQQAPHPQGYQAQGYQATNQFGQQPGNPPYGSTGQDGGYPQGGPQR